MADSGANRHDGAPDPAGPVTCPEPWTWPGIAVPLAAWAADLIVCSQAVILLGRAREPAAWLIALAAASIAGSFIYGRWVHHCEVRALSPADRQLLKRRREARAQVRRVDSEWARKVKHARRARVKAAGPQLHGAYGPIRYTDLTIDVDGWHLDLHPLITAVLTYRPDRESDGSPGTAVAEVSIADSRTGKSRTVKYKNPDITKVQHLIEGIRQAAAASPSAREAQKTRIAAADEELRKTNALRAEAVRNAEAELNKIASDPITRMRPHWERARRARRYHG